MALVYATSPRGACHNQSDYFFVDWGQAEPSLSLQLFGRHAGAEKAANVALHQDWRTVNNALVMCLFANLAPETTLGLVNAACGLGLDDLMRSGERAWNLKRAINNRLGLKRSDERLPKALLEPYADGGAAGYVLPFDEMLAATRLAAGTCSLVSRRGSACSPLAWKTWPLTCGGWRRTRHLSGFGQSRKCRVMIDA